MIKTILTSALSVVIFTASARQDVTVTNPYQNYFNEAYTLYPGIPHGVLEAVAFSNTHFNHITHTPGEEGSCVGMPKAYGVMGLILDGENYFRNNLGEVARLSGYTKEEIIGSPEKNILAYAKAFDHLYSFYLELNGKNNPTNAIANALSGLSELPAATAGQLFACYTQLYGYLSFLDNNNYQQLYGFTDLHLDLKKYFGDNYPILSSSSVKITDSDIKDQDGNAFKIDPSIQSTDYGPAIWNAAASCNYSTSRGAAVSAVTIHDIEGSYAGAISWFQNCQASVSAHYVVRSSDGQMTQMVLEAYKAWHVGSENPYTIGVEHEGYASQSGWYTIAMYNSTANLVKDICNNSGYGIDPNRVAWWPWAPTTYYNTSSIPGACARIKGHQHYPNQTHTDPGPYWDWDYFYKLINPQPAANMITAANGPFYDSGGPTGNYTDDERTVWTISPPNATTVSLSFSSFNLENTWDYVYIYDGTDVWAPLIGYWTGTNSPGTVTANSGSMTVEFRSDCSTTDIGWNASYTSNSTIILPTNLSVTQNSCPQLGVDLNWNNSGAGWYVDVSTDPNFTTFYNKSVANLTTTVCPGSFCDYPNCTSYLKFEPGTTYYWRVWNGSQQTYGSSFTTPVCSTLDANCSGNIYDSGGPSGVYGGNEDYTYTIAPGNASSVTMNFSSLDLEAGYDSLFIYDGASTTAPLLGAYTGTTNPGSVSSTGGAITLHFISDPFVNNNGFAASWGCSQTTGINEISNELSISAYPNPASDVVDIEYSLNASSPVQVVLVDMLGREISLLNEASEKAGKHVLHIDINQLALSKGMYDVRIMASGSHANVKLLIAK